MAVDISSPALHHAWTTLQDPASSVEFLVLAYPPGSFAAAMSRVSSRSNLRAARSEAAAAAVAANSTPPVTLDLIGCGSLTSAFRIVPSRTKRPANRDKLEHGLSLASVRELLAPGEVRFILLRVQLKFLLVQYLSTDLITLRRARALVHGRSLAAHMTRLDSTVVITEPSELTAELVHDSLELSLPDIRPSSRSSSAQAGSAQGSSVDGTGSATPRHHTAEASFSRASAGSPTHSEVSSCLSTSNKESTDTATTRSSTVPSLETVPSIREPRSRELSEEGDGSYSSSFEKRSIATGSISSLSSTPPLVMTPTLTPPPDDDPEEQARLDLEKGEYLDWLRKEEDRLAKVEAGKEHRREVIKWQRDETRRKQVLAKLQQEQEQWLHDGTLTLPVGSTLMLPIPSSGNDLLLRSPITTPTSPLSIASACSRGSFQGRRNARPPPLQPPPSQALPPSPGGPPSSSLLGASKTPTSSVRAATPSSYSSSSSSTSHVSPNRASFPNLQPPRTPSGEVTPRGSSIYSSSLLTVPAQRVRATSAGASAHPAHDRVWATAAAAPSSSSSSSSSLGLSCLDSSDQATPKDSLATQSTRTSRGEGQGRATALGDSTVMSAAGSPRAKPGGSTVRQMEEQGLDGESWLSRMQRRQSAEGPEWAEERRLAVRKGLEKDLPPVPPIPPLPTVGGLREASRRVIEAGRAAQAQLEQSRREQQRLAFEVSQVERAQRERHELEMRAREKWAREREDRERLDAFERSKIEHEERQRREAAEKLQQEEELRASNARAQKQRFAHEEAEALDFLRRQQREVDEQEARLRIEAENARRGREEAEARQEKRRVLRERLVAKLRSKAGRGEAMVQGIYDVQIDGRPWRSRWLCLKLDELTLYNPEDKARTPPTERTMLQRGDETIHTVEEPFEELQMPHSFRMKLSVPSSSGGGSSGGGDRTYEISARTAADKLKLMTAIQVITSPDLLSSIGSDVDSSSPSE